jgi:hypothetical protein
VRLIILERLPNTLLFVALDQYLVVYPGHFPGTDPVSAVWQFH